MSLNLDARQRAMLQDMGITVWAPRATTATATAAAAAAAATTATPLPAPAAAPELSTSPAPAAVASAMPVAAPSVPATALAPPAAPVTPAAPADALPKSESNRSLTQTASTQAAPDIEAFTPTAAPAAMPAYRAPATVTAPWFMAPLVQAYADSATAEAPDAGWLIAVECADPHDPWAGEAGQLLDNMLRALRLQRHPQVRIAPLTRHAPTEGADSELQPLAPALQMALAAHHPARVLVLGLHAARAVLQRSEALGPLRAELHQLHGVPTVVSYDPAYLLRAAHAKPGAWTDLCRAHSLQSPAP